MVDVWIANRGAQQLLLPGQMAESGNAPAGSPIPPGRQRKIALPDDDEARKKVLGWLDRYRVERADSRHDDLPEG